MDVSEKSTFRYKKQMTKFSTHTNNRQKSKVNVQAIDEKNIRQRAKALAPLLMDAVHEGVNGYKIHGETQRSLCSIRLWCCNECTAINRATVTDVSVAITEIY
jgi:hypothetical protein